MRNCVRHMACCTLIVCLSGCTALHCTAMQCNAMQCNAMQCNTMQCNAMQCNAMRCAHPAARRVDCTLLPVSNAPSSFVFITVTCVTFDELTQLVVASCAYTLLDAYRPVQSPRPARGACSDGGTQMMIMCAAHRSWQRDPNSQGNLSRRRIARAHTSARRSRLE